MSIKSARKKKAKELKEKNAAEKAAKKLQDKTEMYTQMFDATTFSQTYADRLQSHQDMMNNISYNLDDSVVKQANYDIQADYEDKQKEAQRKIEEKQRQEQQQFYEENIDVDIDSEAVRQRQYEIDRQNAAKQKEAARNSKIDGVVDDLFDVNSNSHEAHSALNAMNRDGFFDSQEDFQTAKARLTAKYDAKPTRASIPRPGVTKEGLERTEGYAIKTVKPGLEFKVNSNAKGELSGIGSMRGGTAGELADATVGNPYFKQVFTGRNLGAVLNLGFAINDFNEARDAGDGVVKAAAKAGTQFVAGEMLGAWMFPVMLAKQAPTMAISAIEGTQKITRQMNSTGRMQTFGEAHFRDTQQLATMRQAGMELAKMSQYNLQQSMMGNEAQYMHRL